MHTALPTGRKAVTRITCAAVVLLLAAVLSPVSLAGVLWTTNGVTVSSAPGDQQGPVSVPDGEGGSIIAWVDYRGGATSDIYAQRLSGAGVPQWTSNGKAVCNAAGTQEGTVAVADGEGGAIIAWTDSRTGPNAVIYAQRLLPDGASAWTSNGVALSAVACEDPRIALSGNGAAVVCWYNSATGSVEANRVSGNAPSWGAAGQSLSDGPGGESAPVIAADGSGGAIAAFQDNRSGDEDIYANRIASDGSYPWGTSGTVVRNGPNDQAAPVAAEGGGGAIFFWKDTASSALEANKVGEGGTLDWGGVADPVDVCAAGGQVSSYTVVADGGGGGVFAWDDRRSGTKYDIYAQRVNADGATRWSANGVVVKGGTGNKRNPAAARTDGETMICWSMPASNSDIYAQKLNDSGSRLWNTAGVPVCVSSYAKGAPTVAGDGTGGGIVAWADDRATHDNIYAQRVADDPPTVEHIQPDTGRANTVVDISELVGTGFREGADVFLSRTGYSDIYATDVVVESPTTISCKLDLSGASSGSWDVGVRNTDGQVGVAEAAFTVRPGPSPTWYLPEGSTSWGFDCYITMVNPNANTVHATVTYMTIGGAWSGGTVTMPPYSQATLNPRDVLGAQDFSTKVHCREGETIAVDRTMSWNGGGGASGTGEGTEAHSSVGVTAPATTWYLPEGSSKWGFETWLLIQNPNGGEATCNVTYMVEGGKPVFVQKKVPGKSRATFNMEEDIGQQDASIRVISDQPVIPERAMYRNNRREGHDSIGTTSAAGQYFLAEGTSAWGFTTYVLVQNPNDEQADVTLVYMTSEGPRPQPPFRMPANSRKTVRVNDVLPNEDFSTWVTGTREIIAERAMYWFAGEDEICHDSIGMNSPHKTFFLPDGQTSDGRETWTLVQNPNSEDVSVSVNYLTPDGQNDVSFVDSIPGNSRRSYFMADAWIKGRAAVLVYSKTDGCPIMVERAMYWNNRGTGTETIGGYSD